MSAGVVDSYLHCGASKFARWETVAEVHGRAGVSGAVLAQHSGEFDHGYIIGAAEKGGPSYRVAITVDQRSPDWRKALADLAALDKVVALRIRAEPSEDWDVVARAGANLGLHVLYYLPAGAGPVGERIRRVAAEYPQGRYVLTHLGTPRFDGVPDPEMRALARLDSVVVQLSGLSMWSQFPYPETVEDVRHLLELFVPDRVIWASNFPVCPRYQEELELVRSDPWHLGAVQIEALLSTNARKLWRIDHRTTPGG